MSKKVALLLPFYKSVHPLTTFCLMAIYDRERMRVFQNYGDAFIAHSRNTLARRFLESDCEFSVWFDDDMVFPIGNAQWYNRATGFGFVDKFAGMNTIDRLLGHNKTFVGGLYFGRSRGGKPMYAEGCGSQTEAALCRKGPQDVIKPTKWCASGVWLVHRKVFEDISKRWPHLSSGQWFSSSEHNLVNASSLARKELEDESKPVDRAALSKLLGDGLYLAGKNSPVGLGEDVQFCYRAAQVGHQPHIDLGLVCGHMGSCCYGPYNTYFE